MLQRISSSLYMLDKLQRPAQDPLVLDTFEKIDSSIREIVQELKFLREAHLSSHPELVQTSEHENLEVKASDPSSEQVQKLIEEAKLAAKTDILNPSLR